MTDPDVVMVPPNQAAYPGEGGVCKALLEWTWGAATAPAGTLRKAAQEKERGEHHSQERHSIRVSTYGEDPRPSKRNATTVVSSPLQRQVEEQEAARPACRPCSGERVALPACILHRIQGLHGELDGNWL
ncbi:hypothetical protein NDU88_004920 [Pleurodeles waltl]|uniref:Uncharacterized protein n=1 Tax=Pleurodeles waltl TaxID=8319 RepID=A0AAV7WWT7_PLEWA|nr:hypothetical protein NDU88_004920 [Pleurodeles waltl]